MDAVVRAQHVFRGAVEALESSEVEEDQAERVVHEASAAVDVLSDAVKELGKLGAADIGGSAIEQRMKETAWTWTWLRAVYFSWESIAKEDSGARISQHLDSISPNLCARWLEALKSLGSCASVAKGMITRQKESREREKENSSEDFGSAVIEGETVEGEDLVIWAGTDFLSRAWPELKDRGGLRSSRWHARVSAVEFLSSLAEYDLDGAKSNQHSLALLEDLLRALILGLGISDTRWQVRRALVPAVTRLLTASLGLLPQSLWANLTWGVLAICLDPQPEVEAIAKDSVLHHLLPPAALHSKGVVLGLLDRFITAAVGVSEPPGSVSISLQEDNTLLHAVTAAVLLELVPHQTGIEVQEHDNASIDRIPLLVVATSFALADSEHKGNKVYSEGLSQLLRSLGSYVSSLLAMLNPAMPLYECDKLARYCKRRGVLDEGTAMIVERISTATSLKGLATALESSIAYLETLKSAGDTTDESLGNMQLDALQHISEMLHIPSQLIRNYKDRASEGEIENFLLCGYFYSRMALIFVKSRVWTALQAWEKEDAIVNIFLSFLALASGVIESEGAWVDERGIRILCHDVILCLSTGLQMEGCSIQDEAESPSGGNCSVSRLEPLVLRLLPKILSRLKDVLKAGTRSVSLENGATVPKMDDLPAAIIAAHQLTGCLVQVHYPNFKFHFVMVIRIALTALDHYSPSVKKQGMKSFIHLARNLSATELSGFKDAILDAVTRSLVGCEDLWPVAVDMAVALVTRIESQNPRSHWYEAIMKEMLEDLDRHRSDRTRIVVWLQRVAPLFESMGIMVVAHFRRLLPLLYYWLHAQDEAAQILVLANLRTIIKCTWLRISYHAVRMREELTWARKDGQVRHSSSMFFDEIDDVERLLQSITSPKKAGFRGSQATSPGLPASSPGLQATSPGLQATSPDLQANSSGLV